MHLVCFDIDGTVVNSHELNLEAYWKVGVVVPAYAASLPWQSWLYDLVGNREEAEAIHSEKVRVYSELIQRRDMWDIALPAANIALHLLRNQNIKVRYLTAGTLTTATLIVNRLGIGKNSELQANLTYERRRLALFSATLANYASVTYIDDTEGNVTRLRDDVPDLRVIHYTNQTYKQLMSEIRGDFSA